jgi:hypothetical protein
MTDLVTLAEARAHLRIDDVDSDGSPDDLWLSIFIPAISEAVANWLKDDWRLWIPAEDSNGDIVVDSNDDPVPALGSDGDPTPKWVVKAAVLVELASQYRFREGEGKDNVVASDAGHGYILNKASTALLSGLRKSTVA